MATSIAPLRDGCGERSRAVLGGEHEDSLGSELDRVRDRSVVDHAPVDQEPLAPRDGRQQSGNRGRGQHGVDRGAVREADFLSAHQVESDQVQRDLRVLQPFDLEVGTDQAAQPAVREEVIAMACDPAE